MTKYHYRIDFYVDGIRKAHFTPTINFDPPINEMLEFIIENYVSSYPGENYTVVVKDLENWYIHRLDKDKLNWKNMGRVYLDQIDTIREIQLRFENERFNIHQTEKEHFKLHRGVN